MPIKLSFMLLAFLLSGELLAQGLDSAAYRQAKLNIWCETARFIYADNGADSLQPQLDCQSWEGFIESLKGNQLGVKTFFEAIEKPAIYKGYSTNSGKLDKLIEEIGVKLKSASSRRGEPLRLQKVDSLQVHLRVIAAKPAAHAYRTAPERNQATAAERSQKEVQEVQEAEEPEAALAQASEEGMAWSEILQWVLLVGLAGWSAWLYSQNKQLQKELDLRMARRKQELAALAIKKEKEPLPVQKQQQGLAEEEVVRLIRKELDRFRQQQQMKARKPPKQQPLAQPESKQVPAPAPAVAQKREEQPEVPANGSYAAEAGIYYDKLPFKGGFHQNHLSRQLHADSIYTIQVLKERPEEAIFWVTEDQEVQKYAMENGLSFFEEACEYGEVEESPSRVRNLEKGTLRKKGGLWQIEKKVKVSFE